MVKKTASKKKKTPGKKTKRKGVKAKSIKKHGKKKPTEVVYHSTKEIKVERALIENFIGLQKVMVNLSGKFDSLSERLSKLLDLFEISAKALAKKELSGQEGLETKKVMDKLDNLTQQAGLIGRGLALIHEVGTENESPVIPLRSGQKTPPLPRQRMPPRPPRVLPQQQRMPPREMTKEMGPGYQRSLSLKNQDSEQASNTR